MENNISKITNEINAAMLSGLSSGGTILDQAIQYALEIKGKRLRPLLFLTLIDAYRDRGFNYTDYMDIACAIEYIHTYSLIHDDLPSMDNDDMRRGMPTVHVKFNPAIALLTGDTLLTIAFEKISRASVDPKKIVNIINILTSGIGSMGMAGGQALDLEFKGDIDQIFEIHKRKTAELIAAVFLSAAEILDFTEEQKQSAYDSGISIGIAFQMADDLLDIEGDEKEVGKRLGKDKDNSSPNSVQYYGKEFIVKEIQKSYEETLNRFVKLGVTSDPFLGLIKKMVFRSK